MGRGRAGARGDGSAAAEPAGGEQIYLRVGRDGSWGEPIPVTDGKAELYRPAVAVDGDGRVWMFYSLHIDAGEKLDHQRRLSGTSWCRC